MVDGVFVLPDMSCIKDSICFIYQAQSHNCLILNDLWRRRGREVITP